MNERFSSSYSASGYDGPVPSSSSNDEGVIDFQKIFGVLWRGKILIAFIASLFVLAGGYYAFFMTTPMFKSSAVVMLNNREEQVLGLESVIGGLTSDTSVVNTEVEVLRSRSLLGKVVRDLELTTDPEFNGALRTPGTVDVLRQRVRDFIVPPATGEAFTPEQKTARQFEGSVDSLLGAVSVRNIPGSLVFQITVLTTDANKSALIADRLVELYILNQLEVKFEATQQATEWLTERVTELQIELESAEADLKTFRADSDLVSGESLEALERQLKDVRDRIMETEEARVQSIARQAQLAAATTPDEKVAATGDPQLRQLLTRIETPSIRESFDQRFDQLVTRSSLDVRRADTQIAALEASRLELEEQISEQSADLITLQQLSRETEASRLLYEYFLARLKETSAQQGVQQADSRVLSKAVVPTGADSPRKSRIIFISGVLGIVAGSVLVLLLDGRRDTFRIPTELELKTGYHLMGQVPNLPARKRRDVIAYLQEKPASVAAEAIRNLRTSVMLSNVDTPPQVIVTSSSLPGEGKTTLSLALAHNIAGMGKKVLLVEGDIRRRVMSAYFHERPEGKLVSCILGETTLSEAVQVDKLTGADVIFAEKSAVNAADLFSSDRFRDLIAQAREIYDVIIIDTPPVLVVTDARVIAQHADAVLFVVKWDSTYRGQVLEALKSFESVKQPVSGLVLNQINTRRLRRYGYGNYGKYGNKYYTN